MQRCTVYFLLREKTRIKGSYVIFFFFFTFMYTSLALNGSF